MKVPLLHAIKENRNALCNNGSAHIKLAEKESELTCLTCKKRASTLLKSEVIYLKESETQK